MLALVYDPAVVTDPEGLGSSLGVGATVAGVPPRLTDVLTLPAAGYAIVRQTWAGYDILPGPVTLADIAALPDPGIDPAITLAEARAAVRAAIASDTGEVDPAVVAAALGRLDAIIATGSVDPLPASPTNAEVVAQVRLLTTAVNIAGDAIRDLARIERAVIRLIAT